MLTSMRATKGFFSALGASGALVAAAACALLVVSAIVAERGWPGVASPLSSSQVVAGAGSAHARAHNAATAVPIVRVTGATASVPAHGASTKSPLSPVVRTHRGGAQGGAGPAVAQPGSAIALAGSGTTSSSQHAPAANSTGQGTSPSSRSSLGTTVQNATTHVATKLAPASPAVGNAINQAGKGAGNAVDQTTGAVKHVVPGLP